MEPVPVGMAERPYRYRRVTLSGGTLSAAGLVALFSAVSVAAELGVGAHINAVGLRSAVETAISLSTLLGAILLRIRFRHTRSLRDLLLLTALATVSASDFVFNGMPAFSNSHAVAYGVGPRMTLMIVVAGTFLAVAFTPAWRRVRTGSWLPMLVVPAGIAIVAVAQVVEVITGPATRSDSRAAMTVVAVVASCGMVAAGVRFATERASGRREAELLAGASFLLAGAWLQKLVWPLVPADWVTLGDVARVSAYALLLTTALRLYGRTREQQVGEAVIAERLRIAADLHDGLAQDLAFIVAHGARLAQELGAEHPLAIAARRALAASRGAIVDLEASTAPSTEAAVREVAGELAGRFGIEVIVNAEDAGDRGPLGDLDSTMDERRHLVRIAREAIVNAVHHGNARKIIVTLGSTRGRLLIRVIDDGRGLDDPAARRNPGTGLGMRSMRHRAESLGGHLTARRGKLGGTEICVVSTAGEARQNDSADSSGPPWWPRQPHRFKRRATSTDAVAVRAGER